MYTERYIKITILLKAFMCTLLLVILTGCYDRRNDIAAKLLYSPEDDFKKISPALTGALIGKFPIGSPAINLQKFSESFGGTCGQPEQRAGSRKEDRYDIGCNIHEYGGVCYVHDLSILIKLNGDSISDILAQQSGFGC